MSRIGAFFRVVLKPFVPMRVRESAWRLGIKRSIHFFIIQRIFRVNSHVPWLVDWTTMVIRPDRIKQPNRRRSPLGICGGQYIQAINGIELGQNVWIGPGVKIISADHKLGDYTQHEPSEPVRIGDNCWLGADVVILPGVTLGNHVVVAAGAVVSKSFPNNTLIGGVPAQVLRELDDYTGQG